MNFNETCDLNRDLLSVSGGVLRGAEKKSPMRSSANPHKLTRQKYNQNNLVSPLCFLLFCFVFFLPNVPVISAFPPLFRNSGSSSSLGWASRDHQSSSELKSHQVLCVSSLNSRWALYFHTLNSVWTNKNVQKKREKSGRCHSCRRPLGGGVVPESCPVTFFSNGDVCRGNINPPRPVQQQCKEQNSPALLKNE